MGSLLSGIFDRNVHYEQKCHYSITLNTTLTASIPCQWAHAWGTLPLRGNGLWKGIMGLDTLSHSQSWSLPASSLRRLLSPFHCLVLTTQSYSLRVCINKCILLLDFVALLLFIKLVQCYFPFLAKLLEMVSQEMAVWFYGGATFSNGGFSNTPKTRLDWFSNGSKLALTRLATAPRERWCGGCMPFNE